VELVVGVEVVVLAAIAIAVVPFSPGVSPLALGAAPDVSPPDLGTSPSIPAASMHAYPPWCLPSVASSSSELQLLGQLQLVEAVEDPSQVVVAGVV
jgi:hypothetical protein